jgi:divalent metal cation (Fe/Co/Zn/Cd) transporter
MPAQAHASKKILQTAARVALLGLLINVVLASVKIVAGVIGHAYVLIADGIESALDIGGSIVIWGGLTVAARPPDETHPYGHGKAEPIAAIAVALGVLAAATGLRHRKRSRNSDAPSRACTIHARHSHCSYCR